MDRKTFMRELDYLLQDINAEERQEALEYYESYFDEAGSENEQQVLAELGDPSQVAAMIKDGLKGHFDDHIEAGNEGFSNHAYQKNYEVVGSKKQGYSRFHDVLMHLKEKWQQLDQRDKMIIVVILVIACVPISSAFIGLSGGLLGFAFAFAALFFSLWIITFILYFLAIVLIVVGVLQLFHVFASGLIILGIGCIVITIAQLVGKLATTVYKKVIPQIIDGISRIFYQFVGKRGVHV